MSELRPTCKIYGQACTKVAMDVRNICVVGSIPILSTIFYNKCVIFILMIKLQTLLSEIALAKHTPIDDYLREEMLRVIGTPPKFTGNREDKIAWGEYLTQLQDWAEQHIPEHGVLLDIPESKIYKGTPDMKNAQGVFHFDDEYESFEDLVEDHFQPPTIVLVYPGQLARYVMGADVANRIVIPGRE